MKIMANAYGENAEELEADALAQGRRFFGEGPTLVVDKDYVAHPSLMAGSEVRVWQAQIEVSVEDQP